MRKRIPYSLYKKRYSDLRAYDYDPAAKTIEIELPDGYRRPRFPSEWKKLGKNSYETPNGCRVYFWARGLAEYFLVEHYVSQYNHSLKAFPPSLYAREQVMQYVETYG